eukprot:7387583-Prymnesium_polylepis.1
MSSALFASYNASRGENATQRLEACRDRPAGLHEGCFDYRSGGCERAVLYSGIPSSPANDTIALRNWCSGALGSGVDRGSRHQPSDDFVAIWESCIAGSTSATANAQQVTPTSLLVQSVSPCIFPASLGSKDTAGGQAQASTLGLNLTFGIKHMSDYPKRRHMLCQLVGRIRKRYADESIVVANDGALVYNGRGSTGDRYINIPGVGGLAAGRNMLVQNTNTEFLMIMDDDVEFHRATRVESLLAHLARAPQMSLVAACYYNFTANPCYANNFVSADGSHMKLQRVRYHTDAEGLHVAHLVENVFVARTAALQLHRWDVRQQVMEHETFFYKLLISGQVVGFDPSVTVLHNGKQTASTAGYNSLRDLEGHFLQYLCKIFPRILSWDLPYFRVDCHVPSFSSTWDPNKTIPLAWDVGEDASTAVNEQCLVQFL